VLPGCTGARQVSLPCLASPAVCYTHDNNIQTGICDRTLPPQCLCSMGTWPLVRPEQAARHRQPAPCPDQVVTYVSNADKTVRRTCEFLGLVEVEWPTRSAPPSSTEENKTRRTRAAQDLGNAPAQSESRRNTKRNEGDEPPRAPPLPKEKVKT